MKILGIIPARGGSKRVIRKNIKKLAGKELVRYSIETSLDCDDLSSVVLSSDDDAILAIGGEYAKLYSLKRPEELASDTSPAIDYVLHCLEYFKLKGQSFDAVCIIQPTSPFTVAKDISETINVLKTEECTTAVSIMKVDHAVHPIKLKRLEGKKMLPILESENGRFASEQLPDVYVRNGSVYVTRISSVLEGVLINEDSCGYIMDRDKSIDINDTYDFDFAEFLMSRK